MLPRAGPRNENPSLMDRKGSVAVPQLSNEMQLSIMMKVKSGELTIDDALNQARRSNQEQLKQSLATEEQQASQYNFSVYKYNRYRWQKRILQIDFNTKMVCSIEKGIVKRQLPFLCVKSCDDGVGAKFSISFRGRHDYELEATSLEDKHKIMQLVNKIIYRNIYSHPVEGSKDTCVPSLLPAPKSLREGLLFLHRGGLASFKWVKYEARLHPGQLTLLPISWRGVGADGDMVTSSSLPVVIHFSDGDASVEKRRSCDTFTLLTHKNEYQFQVPVTELSKSTEAIQKERDAWVQAIDKLCLDWKRTSQSEHFHEETRALRICDNVKDILEENKSTDGQGLRGTDLVSSADNLSAGEKIESKPPTSPLPKPCSPVKLLVNVPFPGPVLSPVPIPVRAPVLDPVPATVPVPIPSMVPAPPFIPMPPPLPFKPSSKPLTERTRAFHWDEVGSDKIEKSCWTRGNAGNIEIDTSRLYEQFAVQDLGTFGGITEPSTNLHIMLNTKVAHNFNIFLKSFHVQPGELKDKLFLVNEGEGGFSDEQITSLRRYVPTSDDVEMYKSYKGSVSELHVVDQYMMEMCNIPYLNSRLDLLLTLRELPISMEDLQPLINQKIRMCTQMYSSRSFVSVLEYLLAIGNYLNENAGKRKAKGFRLSSLTKLSQLRGIDRKFTLLHALVEQIMLHEPGLATFPQELTEFETVPGASIKGLTAEVDVLKNELQKTIQYKKTYKRRNQGDQHPKFSKDLKMAIEKYNTDLSLLTKRSEEMKKLYSDILVKFGEPMDQDSQELFGLVCQFVNDFKETHAEIR
ncbi:protein diaphanous homolog 1 [Salmo trutta]|uniref:Protein diaphanous homolog 1-like n=1 Tax=Salmo trutta TaxID=8032 RepID=A0A674BNX2_SALTR|nr:protein diaphanous homolog 1-like [Salmo trutta]